MLLALVLVALNLRLAITSAASLLTLLTDAGALNSTTVVLIPAIPTAVFALAGVSTAKVSAKWGVERTVVVGLAVLSVGLMVRAVPQPWVIVLGTVIATGGLAVVNILLPAVVRLHFPRNISRVTTVYSTTMSLGAATAAATAVPIAQQLGSPTLGLAAWALPALVALVVWAVVMPLAKPVAAASVGGSAAAATGEPKRGFPVGTWLLASFFAIQSLLSYIIMGWLPTIATDAGLSHERAGLLLGIAMAVGVPGTILIMPLTRGAAPMRVGFAVVGSATTAGVLGFLLAPTALPEVWAGLLGLGMCAFPLALALIATIGRDASESAKVSTAVQSIGYTVATLGPLGAGALHQATGAWTPVLVLLIVGALAQITVGVILTGVVWKQLKLRGSAVS